ncbi:MULTISPECIES: PLP-dependent aminotransferase family protein [unclassified Bradyrhizobium]|uniref:aminotransferase-like domain-containing protein n=1 Tax=unclassified Bradyrhizobium TaxID=2631580 RepID=UPI0028E5C01C|nr:MULTISPECIES: PLP-dependent aminotransferase family protein [unclassified Bradyrhizobium]
MVSWKPVYARRADRMKASEIRELLKVLERPGMISFAGGIPDPALFPVAAAAQVYADALASPDVASAALQYAVSEGYGPLRQWIAEHMTTQGIAASPDNILVTAGSQQALDFLGKLLLTPADTALVTVPTYLGALQAFSAYEPRYDSIGPRAANRTPASYADEAAKEAAGARVKFVYVVPDFANPTGETLSRSARADVLDLAGELDVPVLEDSAYSALRFDGDEMQSLQSLDVRRRGSLDASRVIHLGTFSKTVAPGLRIGWVCASRAIISRLVLVKQASDLNVSAINQIVMHRLVKDGGHAGLIARARAHYRLKRDAMLRALEAQMPSEARWTRPDGGFFVWLTLPDGVSGAALLDRAVNQAQVAFVPGAAFFHDGSGTNTIRLSYSLPEEAVIEEGIGRLASLLR